MDEIDDDEPENGAKVAGTAGRERRMQRQTAGDGVLARQEERKQRLAKTLRDNLARRKQQGRARRAGDPDEASGLPAAPVPAAKKDESGD